MAGTRWPATKADWFDAWVAFGRGRATYRPLPPTGEMISRMDEVMDWVAKFMAPSVVPPSLPPDISRILWQRAGRMPWRRIIAFRRVWYNRHGVAKIPGGNSHVSVRLLYQRGLDHLATRLAAEKK